jgi:peptide/nickel transport system ATP-binding protein
LGLVGESGSGKSSIGKAILNLIPFSSQSLRFNGRDLLSLPSSEWRVLRKSMQIIYQDPYSSLNPRKNIGATLMEPMYVHSIGASRKDRYDMACHLLEAVGLTADQMKRYPHQFSGGQRQRIGIARALSLSPEFIVCDESVSALDVSIQAQILNLLMDIKNRFHLSYLFISHDLSVVNFVADRILVMNQGRIEEEGKPYQIINHPQQDYTKALIDAIPT